MKFRTGINFLPEKGWIYVDTCGPSWIPPEDERWEQRIYRLADFNQKLEERGGVLTTPKIFAEIEGNIAFFEMMENHITKKRERYLKKNKGLEDVSEFDSWILADQMGIEEYTKLYGILQKGCEAFKGKYGGLNRWDVVEFYSRFKIHEPDRELVLEATLRDSDNGILTSDSDLIKAYLAGLKEFGIGGFVCDSMREKTTRVYSRKKGARVWS